MGGTLLFHIGASLYSVSLGLVTEILNVQHITHLPGVPYYIKGIINLRGKVVPVIDVRLKLGMEERAYDDKTCIIVVELHEMQLGIIVDSVSEVVTVDTDHTAAPPDIGQTGGRYLASVSEIGGRVVLNIDCDKFFQSDIEGMNLS